MSTLGPRLARCLALALATTAATAPGRADPLIGAHLGAAATIAEPSLEARFGTFMASLRREALAAGISAGTFERATAGLTPAPDILELMARQPEHVLAPWDYVARLVSESRIAEGRTQLEAHGALLAGIEARHGVDRHVLVAIWGVESSYGTLAGTRPVVRSLATLASADQRRPAFWQRELIAALRILESGDTAAERMVGSWAGAMGHTQFMPTSYQAHAVDFDGDGRRDIWGTVGDALASTANYLARSGWKAGETWGLEVVLPAGFDYAASGPNTLRSTAEWQGLGVAPPGGRIWPERLGAAALLLPAGMHGPAFLVGDGFKAILKYNNSTSYALAVGLLADRLSGHPGLAAPWPTDDAPLDGAGRRELQQRLLAAGLQPGPIDGILGDGTRNAVRLWQLRQRLPADGWAGTRLLEKLRRETASLR